MKYADLLKKVKKIDEEAFYYLLGGDFGIYLDDKVLDLAHLFDWNDTPQGSDYWVDIAWEIFKDQLSLIPPKEYTDKGAI